MRLQANYMYERPDPDPCQCFRVVYLFLLVITCFMFAKGISRL